MYMDSIYIIIIIIIICETGLQRRSFLLASRRIFLVYASIHLAITRSANSCPSTVLRLKTTLLLRAIAFDSARTIGPTMSTSSAATPLPLPRAND